MEVYVVLLTKGINYEGEYSEVGGVYSTLEEAKRQAYKYLSEDSLENEDIPKFDGDDDRLTIEYKPKYGGDEGCITIEK